MRKMKDSGIEWIGEIPESWEVHRVKNHFSIISGSGFKTDYQGDESGDFPVCKASDISNAGHKLYSSANYISQEVQRKEGFSVIPAGSILFAKIGEAMKKNNRTLTMVDACADNNCQAMVPQNIHSEYAYYLFSCIDMQWFDNAGTIPCINNTKLLDFKMAYPSMEEQLRITDYLDQKCAEIDAIIAAKEKTNELLKERRQSIIYEAVTKGLDPTVPMKDSGIEWIGEIPESWEVHRIKNHFSIISGSGFKTDYQGEESGDLPVCKASDISNAGHRLYGSANYISQEVRQKEGFSVIPAGSILFAKIGEAMKKNNRTLTMVDACADNNCQAMVPQNIHSEYAYYLFSCIDMQWFDNAGTIPCINNTKLLNFKMAYPNMDKQNRIAEYLNRVCGEYDALIAANNVTIEKLKEYRQSVIYEAVTGKVEI